MKAGDDPSLCNVNAEYSIYGNEEKTSASSSQLQPKRYRGEAAPQPRSSSSHTGVRGFHCYQGQVRTKPFNPLLPGFPLGAVPKERHPGVVMLREAALAEALCASGLCPGAQGWGGQ